jgi:gas vesicle protein
MEIIRPTYSLRDSAKEYKVKTDKWCDEGREGVKFVQKYIEKRNKSAEFTKTQLNESRQYIKELKKKREPAEEQPKDKIPFSNDDFTQRRTPASSSSTYSSLFTPQLRTTFSRSFFGSGVIAGVLSLPLFALSSFSLAIGLAIIALLLVGIGAGLYYTNSSAQEINALPSN